MKKSYCTAVVLAAGNGSRMKSKVAKQFLELAGKPLIYYALNTMQSSEVIDDILLVTGENDIDYMQTEIVDKFAFDKVRAIIAGGSERCFSVANAMQWIDQNEYAAENGLEKKENKQEKEQKYAQQYVFIHDGARPFLTEQILMDTLAEVCRSKACVAAVPSKDTIKLVDTERYAVQTPDRKNVWSVQTPQVFEKDLIVKAYQDLVCAVRKDPSVFVTDDASVVELFSKVKVRMVEASYRNIKVTTPEDMLIAEAFLKQTAIEKKAEKAEKKRKKCTAK